MKSTRATRRSFVVTAMSTVAGLWASMSGVSVLTSMLPGCKPDDTEGAQPELSAQVPTVASSTAAEESNAPDAGHDDGADASVAASASAASASSSAASAPAARKYGGPMPATPTTKYGGPPAAKYGGPPPGYGRPPRDHNCGCAPGDLACAVRCASK